MMVLSLGKHLDMVYGLFANEELRRTILGIIFLGFNVDIRSTASLDQIDIGDVVVIHVTHTCWSNWQAGFLHFWRIPVSEELLNSALTKILNHSEFVDGI